MRHDPAAGPVPRARRPVRRDGAGRVSRRAAERRAGRRRGRQCPGHGAGEWRRSDVHPRHRRRPNPDGRGRGPSPRPGTRRLGGIHHPRHRRHRAAPERPAPLAAAGHRDAAPPDAHRRYQRDGRPVAGERGRRPADRRTARPRFPFAVRSRPRPACPPDDAVRRARLRRGVPALDDALCRDTRPACRWGPRWWCRCWWTAGRCAR